MLFLVACVYDEGVEATRFRVVQADSRLAVAQAIVESPDIWSKFLHDAHLYDPKEAVLPLYGMWWRKGRQSAVGKDSPGWMAK